MSDRATIVPGEPGDPLDIEYINSLRIRVLDPIIDHWFRASLHGAEKLPDQGPIIIASNHSGNAFPHDALVLDALLWRHDNNAPEKKCRSVYSPKLARSWVMRLFGIDNFWRRCGAVDMTFYNFRSLLRHGERVIYYPEGIAGIGKGFNKRYQLQPFANSFVQLASELSTPIYPVYAINAEWVNPTSISMPWLNRWVDKISGIPFFPIPAALIAMVFPFFFYFGFPCKMMFFIGDPIRADKVLAGAGWDGKAKPGRSLIQKATLSIQQGMQAELDRLVALYGSRPYDLPDLVKALRDIPGKSWPVIGIGWPYGFIRHERDLERKPAKNAFHFWMRDIDILAYYIPFLGWPIIALLRWLRKPPYGYRGLSHPEKKKRQGGDLWSLMQIPLIPRSIRFRVGAKSRSTHGGDED
jgi:1-acyl-sn-glycerol-3-phosphate acyltransferase